MHLLEDLIADSIDLIGAASDGLQVVAENGKELLLDDARVLDVLEDVHHMLRLGKNLSNLGEVPPGDGGLTLDVCLGAVELGPPFVEALDSSVNVVDGGIWLLLEDGSDVDLVTHLLADLRGDGVQDVLEHLLIVVNVTRNGPNELESIEE